MQTTFGFGRMGLARLAKPTLPNPNVVCIYKSLQTIQGSSEAGEIICLVASVRPSADALTFELFDL